MREKENQIAGMKIDSAMEGSDLWRSIQIWVAESY